jgi:hypothetical protein
VIVSGPIDSGVRYLKPIVRSSGSNEAKSKMHIEVSLKKHIQKRVEALKGNLKLTIGEYFHGNEEVMRQNPGVCFTQV